MSKLNVKHFLNIYTTRMKMQEKGLTNPTQEIKDITRTLVQKLSDMPLEEELKFEGRSLIDSSGNVIVTFRS